MRKILYIALFSVLAVSAKAQIPINTFFDVSTPNPIDGRFVIPTLADTSTITDLYDGLLTVVQNTDQLWQYDGTKWVQFHTAAEVNAIDAGDYFYGTDLEAITQETGRKIFNSYVKSLLISDTIDILATGQSNMVNRDDGLGYTAIIDSFVLSYSYTGDTFAIANPALNNISPEDDADVGRSNIAWSFAKNLRQYCKNDSVIVRIMVSAEGARESQYWTPEIEAGYSDNRMLDSIINKLSRAPSDFQPDIILYHQGEQDDELNLNTAQYLVRIQSIYDTLISHNRINDLAPMLLGQVYSKSVTIDVDTISALIDSVATGKIKFSNRKIFAATYTETAFDDVHFTNEAIDRIGEYYLNAFFESENISVTSTRALGRLAPSAIFTKDGANAYYNSQIFIGQGTPTYTNTAALDWRAGAGGGGWLATSITGGIVALLNSSNTPTFTARAGQLNGYQISLSSGGVEAAGDISAEKGLFSDEISSTNLFANKTAQTPNNSLIGATSSLDNSAWYLAPNSGGITAIFQDKNEAISGVFRTYATSGYQLTLNSGGIETVGAIDTETGYRVNNTAITGNYLRGNGTNFVSSTIQESDLPTRPISDITGLAHNVTTATTNASGDIVVTHGLGATPTTVLITGGTNDDRTYQVLEASKTSTQFTVRVFDAGSTLVSSSATFNWIAIE